MKYINSITHDEAVEAIRLWKEAANKYHDFIKEFISIVGQDEIVAYGWAKEALRQAVDHEKSVDEAHLQHEYSTHFGPPPSGDSDSSTGETTTPTWAGA